jgi:soluble lytic murein transglycosylase-like protein
LLAAALRSGSSASTDERLQQMRVAAITFVAACTAAGSCSATCWDQAAATHGVPANLLYAVASAESDLKPTARNMSHLARTGTYDIGLMQINSGHLPRLRRFGISESDLYVPCTNVMVGAWILADLVGRHGLSWDAVGAYNAACTQLRGHACSAARNKYAWRVYRRLAQDQPQLLATAASVSEPPLFILSARVSP